ncbi:MAG TPA: c-type cytochrome [Candidatus Sulfopaludibacter sp.]|jgi:cytochrome c oxidase cbb3-type subunit 3|nr:c-type cytochrome [Candidatus Sulfopaludibacter sp.]
MRAALLLLLSTLAWAQPAAIERGRAAFKGSCGFCHGDDATGNRAPDLVRSPSLSHDLAGEVVGPIIRNGRPDKGMPPFATLTAGQISDIVLFLHKQASDALHSNGVPRDYPLKRLLTGNAEAGRAYFNGPGRCATCHSPTADLKGIAAKHAPLDLQQRFLYPSGADQLTATVTLPDGQTLEGPVAQSDEFEIAITAKDGWYHSWPRDKVKIEIHDPLSAHRALIEKYTDADIHNVFAYLETLK